MKIIVALLFITLSIGFYSCSEKIEDVNPVSGAPTSFEEMYYSKYIDDYENMTCKFFLDRNDTIIYTGLTDEGYLMINFFQKGTNNKLFDWVDNVKTDTIYRIHRYDEYKKISVESIRVGEFYMRSAKSFVTLLEFVDDNTGFIKALFVDEGQSQMTDFLANVWTFIPNWYNNRYSFIHDCCYTSCGDTLYTIKYDDFDFGDIYLHLEDNAGIQRINDIQFLSVNEVLMNNVVEYEKSSEAYVARLVRFDLKQDKIIWRKEINLPFVHEANAKFSYSMKNKSVDVWEYKVCIYYFDGTERCMIFDIDIKDGSIIKENVI